MIDHNLLRATRLYGWMLKKESDCYAINSRHSNEAKLLVFTNSDTIEVQLEDDVFEFNDLYDGITAFRLWEVCIR